MLIVTLLIILILSVLYVGRIINNNMVDISSKRRAEHAALAVLLKDIRDK